MILNIHVHVYRNKQSVSLTNQCLGSSDTPIAMNILITWTFSFKYCPPKIPGLLGKTVSFRLGTQKVQNKAGYFVPEERYTSDRETSGD
jgi:hypothetical protein